MVVSAGLAAIIFGWHQRAAALRTAGLVGMIVGPGGGQLVLHKAFALEGVEHDGGGIDEGFGFGAIETVADVCAEILQGIFARV
jgi:hypothetical protein